MENLLDLTNLPELLKQISDPPRQLYYRGNLSCLQQPCLAIVGTRSPSAYGQSSLKMIMSGLANQPITIVSGLALGIDSLAHKLALDLKLATVAVLPAGVDKIYPASHQALAERILENGGLLLSEYGPGTRIYKNSFVERNRIISGLSQAVFVPEAAHKSGSLHTANFALDQGREVCAMPGPIDSPLSAGTNQLIKIGATPILSPEGLLEILNLKASQAQRLKLSFDSQNSQKIYAFLIDNPGASQDQISRGTNLLGAQTSSELSLLEIEGYVVCEQGEWRLT